MRIKEKIEGMIKDGKLMQVVLLDTEGMVVEAVGDMYDSEVLSAIFFPFQSFVNKVREDLKISEVEEFSLKSEEGKFMIILRYFTANEMKFFIIAICPVTSSYRQLTTELIHLFHEMIGVLPGEDIQPEPLETAEQEIEKELDIPPFEGEKEIEEIIQPVKTAGMAEEMKEVVKKITEEINKAELIIGGKPSSEISEETIDLISYKLVKKLSSNIVEKMIQKVILQITDNLIKNEILKIKKEIETIFSS